MSELQFRTFQMRIKSNHSLFPYFQQMCSDAKNMYNTTNFYIRQVFTAFRSEGVLQPLQQEVLDALKQNIEAMNESQRMAWQSRMDREQLKPLEQRREVKLNLFELPSSAKPYINYNLVDSLFKVMKQPDYRALPTQSSQWVMKTVFQNWTSFFASLKEYRQHPEKYQARPRIPSYSKGKEKEIQFTNQDCTIKDNRFLKFPKTSQRLNIGKLGASQGKLKQVRVIPKYGQYVVELIFAFTAEWKESLDKQRYMAIDLGVDNLATIVTTTGSQPMLVKGKHIKSVNQYFNKMKAHYISILRQGQDPSHGQHMTKRIQRLCKARHGKIKDLFHKASYHIVQQAIKQNIGAVIIGQNKGWKQKSNIGKRNNQSFCNLPHHMLTSMLQYKAAALGITVTVTEESYTSKASFLDLDPLPTKMNKTHTFSGKRIHRGLYQSPKGLINADVNGAGNILRKVVPTASAYGIAGLGGTQSVNVSTPLVLSIR